MGGKNNLVFMDFWFSFGEFDISCLGGSRVSFSATTFSIRKARIGESRVT